MTVQRRPIAPIVGAILGVPLMAAGVVGVLGDSARVDPWELARWVVGADLGHDLVLAPLVLVLGAVIGRVLPASVRDPVRWAAATSAVLALIAIPFLGGRGRNASVPSLLNRNYGAGLLGAIAVVWALAALWGIVRMVRRRRG